MEKFGLGRMLAVRLPSPRDSAFVNAEFSGKCRMGEFGKGQRWISESEPELGIGVLVDTAPGRVFLLFRASGTVRQYATGSAPIKRVKFGPGDAIKTHDGTTQVVESVEERPGGVLVYQVAGGEVSETELSDTLSFAKPEDRLLVGQVEESPIFDLRQEAWRRRHQIRHARVRGLLGARIDLIPHQLYIAREVASRALPRVLLADEVGLGKTIEACLILHRLHRSGRAARILILVPEPLVHQWFVELLRRFALRVSIFDEERCQAIESGDPEANPFLDDQVILCPIGLLAEAPKRGEQAVAAGWDLIVVDEAHHLTWSPEAASPEYTVVQRLAAGAPGLILLTATPEQLGAEGHFARLRLLDPDRYDDFARFGEERLEYRQTAGVAAKLLDGKNLTPSDAKILRKLCQADPARLETRLAGLKKKDADSRDALIQELLDQHGPGRVMFRNTRAAMKGFPKRKLHLVELPAQSLAEERRADGGEEGRVYNLAGDVRLDWLVAFLQKKRTAKVLLICRTREKVLALDEALRAKINWKIGLFHEGLTLLQRDRNAAWFAEADGAQLLICSEIGSEGRNFQFAHHLVLFDLPEEPELLEQRIGRLDRIGQTETINIHVACPKGSHLAVLARWYHEALDAFERPLEGAQEMMGRFGDGLKKILTAPPTEKAFLKFLGDSAAFHRKIADELEGGQDRLLQMNSYRPEAAKEIVAEIAAWDADPGLEEFMLRVFDHYGVSVEELSARTYLIVPAQLTTDAFPDLPAEGVTMTCDRVKALSREDIGFLTWDHPLVTGAIDLLLSSEQGTSSFAVWEGGAAQSVFLETQFLVEPVAPPALHADRFLPPTPVRIVVNPAGEDVTSDTNPEPENLQPGPVFQLLDNNRIKHKLLPAMLEQAKKEAEKRATAIRESAEIAMRALLEKEIARLRDLQKRNDHIRDDEVHLLESQMSELGSHFQAAPVRLDAVRLLWRMGK